MRLTEILKLMRVKHYVKNLFIFLPIFFGLKLFHLDSLLNTFIAFVAFSFITSTIYIINDIIDLDSDKKHPKKKHRPLAVGTITVNEAVILLLLCILCAGTIIIFMGNMKIILLTVIYLLVNIFYSFWIKHIALLDVFTISLGFVIRILIGGAAADVEINTWIIIMTFLLALFLGFAKRRDDLLTSAKQRIRIRKSVEGYNMAFIDSVLLIISTITIVSYLMFSISQETIAKYNSSNIYITTFFVFLGILRYLQLTISFEKSGSPTDTLYKDKPLLFIILGWLISFGIIIYL